MASSNNNNNTSGIANKLQRPPPGALGKSNKTVQGYSTGEKYINRFLFNYNYPPLSNLTNEAVEGEHLLNFIENVGMFIATTNFDKDGGGLVGASAKITYFKAAKEVFKYTFPSHELWRDEEWWEVVGSKEWCVQTI